MEGPPVTAWPGTAETPPIEWTLMQVVNALSDRVQELEARVAKLERGGDA